ncbi:hypothetical protein GCM10010988_12530 [Cnuibacter physcomitrellae]|uniref:Uncharacterized protein n=1 Tax=Cnuibacter physcomitrellae TaxID=1619308 RepID=A0A1X9LNQ3_9MICO|nr:DUF4244 domain-containing protein [Cnuibacter physcomitrellae]ARJ06072.1 hypothetical protein B5808_13215 [Cnuibacter physcomitrellae]GGI37154.1 hypothetical protein GCM10010988_12530 [Cnuibacter physcomitrellae]
MIPTRRTPTLRTGTATFTRRARIRSALADESGAATAEYAIATLAAVGLAGLLVTILRGDEVRGMLAELVRRALSAG